MSQAAPVDIQDRVDCWRKPVHR